MDKYRLSEKYLGPSATEKDVDDLYAAFEDVDEHPDSPGFVEVEIARAAFSALGWVWPF